MGASNKNDDASVVELIPISSYRDSLFYGFSGLNNLDETSSYSSSSISYQSGIFSESVSAIIRIDDDNDIAPFYSKNVDKNLFGPSPHYRKNVYHSLAGGLILSLVIGFCIAALWNPVGGLVTGSIVFLPFWLSILKESYGWRIKRKFYLLKSDVESEVKLQEDTLAAEQDEREPDESFLQLMREMKADGDFEDLQVEEVSMIVNTPNFN